MIPALRRWWLRQHGIRSLEVVLLPAELAPRLAAPSATLVGGQRIYNVHAVTACLGRPCAVHNPTDHYMALWPQNWRDDRKLMERVCPHGIGHPDPDHMAWVVRTNGPAGFREAWAEGVHGCDGCCRMPRSRQVRPDPTGENLPRKDH